MRALLCAQFALSVSGALRSRLCPVGLAFIYPALATWLVVNVQKSDFHLINMFCAVIIAKNVLDLAQVVSSYFVLDSSKMALALTTKGTHLRSLLLRQPDGVNCAVRRVDLVITPNLVPKQSSAVSGLWVLTVSST